MSGVGIFLTGPNLHASLLLYIFMFHLILVFLLQEASRELGGEE